MEYKGNITLPTYTEYCDGLFNEAIKKKKKVKCPACNGDGFVTEELESSQGNYHEIEEACEQCWGDGKVEPSANDNPGSISSVDDYKLEMIETVRKLSSWTRTDFFLNVAKCKTLFIKGGYYG